MIHHILYFRRLLLFLLAVIATGRLCLAAPDAEPPVQQPAGSLDQETQEEMAVLNQAVDWYHQSQASNGWLLEASDAYYWNSERALANEALRSAFESARAMDALMAHQAPPTAAATAQGAQTARLSTRLVANSEELNRLHGQLTELDRKLSTAADPDAKALRPQRAILQAEINLDTQLANSLEKLSTLFVTSANGSKAASMAGQIATLQQTVPQAFDSGNDAPGKTPTPPVSASAASEGLINRAATLFSLVRSERAMDRLIARTTDLESAVTRLADPLSTALRTALHEGEDASEQASGLSDPTQLDVLRAKIERATAQMRDLSGAVLPLRQEAMALERCNSDLTAWRCSLANQTGAILRILFFRAVSVLAALGILLAVAEIWRRATFRYVHDLRRRRQFLLVRRFLTGTLMGIVFIMGFVSDFSSLATFAGFITAGIAVALQTVVLSVAAYFFLIGRYGVRVGDRVTVSGVTGDVIDIGLVRVFLLELVGSGTALHPTGRVVVLANSALFSSTPLYKQLPGSEYTWHEVYAPVAPEADTAQAEERLLAAVNAVYTGYRPVLEHQRTAVERLIDLKLDVPAPSVQIRFADNGLELVVRYPVEIHRVAEIDGLVTRKVVSAIAGDAGLKQVLAGPPRIRSTVKF